MKIISLYSHTLEFTELNFKSGCNLILGGKLNSNSDIIKQHNVGKTLCLELIDFCLLSDFNSEKKLYLLQEQLIDYSFFLQIEMFDKHFLTICRSIQFPNVVNFIEHTKEIRFENLDKFTERTLSDTKLIFSEIISKIFVFNIDFRKFVKRFIRFSDQFVNPLNIEANKPYRKKDIDWIPNLMNSIGFDFKTIHSFYINKTKFLDCKTKVTNFKKAFEIKVNKTTLQKRIDKFDSQLLKMNKNINIKENEILEFDFQNIDEDTINKIINEINKELIPLNREKYYLLKKIKHSKETLKLSFSSEINENLLSFYNEVGLVFRNEIKKDFNDLIEFNKTLLNERKVIAKEQINLNKIRLNSINKQVSHFAKLRNQKIELLETSNIKKKYQLSIIELDELKKEIYDIEYEKEKYLKILKIIEQKEEAEQEMKSAYNKYEEKKPTNKIIENHINKFEIEIEKAISEKYSINFDEKKPNIFIVDKSNKPIAESSTYTKLISIYFDLILANSINSANHHIMFLIHDNLFSDMQEFLKHKVTNLMLTLSKTNNMQFIFTDFKDSLPTDLLPLIEDKRINLVAELYRTNTDVSSTLFRRDLKMDFID